MAWIRLSDDYNDHPKFDHLSDGAFRLWHSGMAFCRKYKTDGNLPLMVVRKFKAYSPKRASELTTPWMEGENPLWHVVASFGFRVHDYLDWNLSKDEEADERSATAARVRKFRSRNAVTDGVTDHVTGDVTSPVSNGPVLDRIGIGKERTTDLEQRFADFWTAYPRKVGKDAAWRAWQKRRPSVDLTRKILAALTWQQGQEQWTKDGGQYIPHPATWLNQGRWDDEPSEAPKTNGSTVPDVARTAEYLRQQREL